MRIASHNVNGIRAAVRRGYADWARASDPDVICLQEVRSPAAAIPPAATDGYHVAYHEGDRAGRNGVAVLTRHEPAETRVGFGSDEFDAQGRYIEVDLPGITVASLYLPKGDVYGEKYEAKMRFMTQFADHVRAARKRAAAVGRELVICGDYNIAHSELDIKAWKRNLKSDGFLPEERAWLDGIVGGSAGGDVAGDGATGGAGTESHHTAGHDTADTAPLVDVIRHLQPDQDGPYSWWSWRGKAFDNDAGWRIDYHLASPGLAEVAVRGWVDRAPSYAERVSDHAPVLVDYRLRQDSRA